MFEIDTASHRWRLYAREWVTVHMISRKLPDAYPLVLQAQSWANEHLAPRFAKADIRLQLNTDTPMLDNPDNILVLFWVCIQLFTESLRGEFPFSGNAHVYAERHGLEDYTVVLRGSDEDQEICDGIFHGRLP